MSTKGSHAIGDYVVFVVDGVFRRGYIQDTLGGKDDEPASYVIRESGRDYEVSEPDIVYG